MARPKLLDVMKESSNTTAYNKLQNNVSVTRSGDSLVVLGVNDVHNKATLIFEAPCSCTEVSTITVDGVPYNMIDTLGQSIGNYSGVFVEGSIVMATLDTIDCNATIESSANNTLINTIQSQTDTNTTNITTLQSDKASVVTYNTTITTTWVGSVAPYTQEVTITGLLATDIPHVSPVYSDINATAIAQKEAWACVGKAVATSNTLTFTCFEEAPTTAIPLQIEVVR